MRKYLIVCIIQLLNTNILVMPSKRKPKPEAEPILNADPLMSRGVIVTHPEKHITPGNASIVWLIVMMAIIGGVGAICTTIWWQKEDLGMQLERLGADYRLGRFSKQPKEESPCCAPTNVTTLGPITMPYPNGWHVYAFHDLFSQRLGMNPTPIVEGYESFLPTYAIAFTSTFDETVLKPGLDAIIQKEAAELQSTMVSRLEHPHGLVVRRLTGEWLPGSTDLMQDEPFYYANQAKTIYFITDNAQEPTYLITARVTPQLISAFDGGYTIPAGYEHELEDLVQSMRPTAGETRDEYADIENWATYTEITNEAEKTLMTQCFKDENDGSPDALNTEIAKLEAGKMYTLTLPGEYRLIYTPRGTFPVESFLHSECGEAGSMEMAFHYEDKILWKGGCGGVLPDKNKEPIAYQRVMDCQQSERAVSARFPWY